MREEERARVRVREARPEDDAEGGEPRVEAFVTQYARKLPEGRYRDLDRLPDVSLEAWVKRPPD